MARLRADMPRLRPKYALVLACCTFCCFLGGSHPAARNPQNTLQLAFYSDTIPKSLQLSTMDLLVLASMKNAAKCDK
jgi:hypothetical protein